MRRIALFMAVFALAACNDATSPNGSPIGTYSLRTINGFGLPYTFSNGPVLLSDQLELNSDGSYIEEVHFSNQPDFVEQGFWSINNNLITFNDETDGINYTGSLSGSVLTETFPSSASSTGSVTEVFERN